jgi:hypothetical protein
MMISHARQGVPVRSVSSNLVSISGPPPKDPPDDDDDNEEDENDDDEGGRRTCCDQRTGGMLIPKTAPYGSWKSPITSDLIAAQSISNHQRYNPSTRP